MPEVDLLNRKADDHAYMKKMSELVAADRRLEDSDSFTLTPTDWKECCEKRIPKARTKNWFGMRESFGLLDANWSILFESVTHIKTLQGFLKAAQNNLTTARFFSDFG